MNKKYIIYLTLGFSLALISCKPKQSNYKSIYEAAKEKDTENREEYIVDETVYSYNEELETPKENMNTSVRKEVINPVNQSDESKIKKYSVVVASMGMQENAIALKNKLQSAGYDPIVVKNSQGMYRVIIASATTKEQAIKERASILTSFKREGDNTELRKRYGIPFNDWWILERGY